MIHFFDGNEIVALGTALKRRGSRAGSPASCRGMESKHARFCAQTLIGVFVGIGGVTVEDDPMALRDVGHGPGLRVRSDGFRHAAHHKVLSAQRKGLVMQTRGNT